MKLTVRMDDISPDMDMGKFERFRGLLEKYGVRPLIGVVPDNRDPNLAFQEKDPYFYDMLKKLQKAGYTIALHGYMHVYTTRKKGLFPLNAFSEFAGIELEKQEAMIRQGKTLLEKEGLTVELFMAPAHSYDTHTLEALKRCGIDRMTDGFGTKPYRYKGITFYPISFQRSMSLKKKKGFTTLVVHTNTMTDQAFNEFEGILQQHRNDFIPYSEYLKQPAAKRSFWGHGWEYVLAAAKSAMVKCRG